MIILAGAVLSLVLKDDGVINMAKKSSDETNRSKYYEEVGLAITDEQIERYGAYKEEPFITSIVNRLNEKDWVQADKTITCDNENVHHDNEMDNSVIVLTTKENYEMYIDVNNLDYSATIRENGFVVNAKECTITFDANGKGDTITGSVDSIKVKKGFYTTLSECNYSRTDYSFVGWCLNSDGDGELIPAGNSVRIDDDITYYAIWEKDTVIITFKPNGGSGSDKTQEIAKNTDTALATNTITKTDYEFVKWNTKADGSGTSYNDEQVISINEPLTLYAQWKDKVYTLKYNGNGGTGSIADATGIKGTKVTLPQNSFTRTNCTFKGWGIKSNSTASSEIKQPGAEFEITKDQTLYALWTIPDLTDKTTTVAGYTFVIYGQSNGKYLARPQTNCGDYSSKSPSTTIKSYLDSTFGIPGKIEAKLFEYTYEDRAVLNKCTINYSDVWMYYNSDYAALTYNFSGVNYTSSSIKAKLIPKLYIEPSAVTIVNNATYVTIQ